MFINKKSNYNSSFCNVRDTIKFNPFKQRRGSYGSIYIHLSGSGFIFLFVVLSIVHCFLYCRNYCVYKIYSQEIEACPSLVRHPAFAVELRNLR